MSGKVEIDKGLYLLESKRGWILSGRTNRKQEPNYAIQSLHEQRAEFRINSIIT